MLTLDNYADLDSASTAVLSYLQEKTGFKLWMTTRTTEPHLVVLNTVDKHYGVQPGDVFQWSDSYCSRMIRGEGPNFAPIAQDVTAYHAAPINQAVQIGSYVGVPIMMGDGKLFGTLCAIDTEPKSSCIESEMPLIKMLANLLGLIAERDLRLLERDSVLDQVRNEAQHDTLTGLTNRRGWDLLLAREELKHQRYGSSVSVLMLDLDGLKVTNDKFGHRAGDEAITDATACLKSAIRATDVAARIGGDEFAVLASETDQDGGKVLFNRVMAAFEQQGINISVGLATHDPRNALADTINAADIAMYRMKNKHRKQRKLTSAAPVSAQFNLLDDYSAVA